jgi:hypothetical protein
MERGEMNSRFWRTLLWECAASWRANAADWLMAVLMLILIFVMLRAV